MPPDKFFVTADATALWTRMAKRVQRMPDRQTAPRLGGGRGMLHLLGPPQVTGMFRVYNAGDETIPKYAVMQVSDLRERTGPFSGSARDAYSVEKPDGDGLMYFVNAGDEIEPERFGAGIFPDEPCKVLIDPDAGEPEFSDSFGPVKDEWHLARGIGFLWLHASEKDDEDGAAIFKAGIPPGATVFRNDASETMPAYGVGRVTGEEEDGGTFTTVTKPDGTWGREYLQNGPKEVEAGKFGIGYEMDGIKRKVLYDTGTTPVYAEGWGPKSGSWLIWKGYYGWWIRGSHDTEGGTVWAVSHPIAIVTAKTSAAHAKGATQSVNVFTADAATDTTWDISAKNAYCALAITKECEVSFIGNVYKLIAGDPST